MEENGLKWGGTTSNMNGLFLFSVQKTCFNVLIRCVLIDMILMCSSVPPQGLGRQASAAAGDPGRVAEGAVHLALPRAHIQLPRYHGPNARGGTPLHCR